MTGIPDADARTPTTRPELTNVVFLAHDVSSPLIEIGRYTYYDDEGWRPPFAKANVAYLYGPQRLRIGSFTAIGPGAQFLMPGGTHPMAGPSTYPFTMFGGDWTANTLTAFTSLEQAGDTTIGNDVWIGREAMILPGVTIGDGAIIGARSVVTDDVAPYAVVAGNPARHIRSRFTPDEADLLRRVRWWDWPIEQITAHAAAIMTGTPQQLAELAATMTD